MKIDAFILCYNEIKLFPFALQYWKRNFNHVYIYDNHSNDGILNEFNNYKDFITVIEYDSNNTIDDLEYINIKNNCWKQSNCDFVVVSDFDEFVYSNNLIQELEYMNENDMTIAKLRGYEMISYDFPNKDLNILSHEQIKYGTYESKMCKPILFNPKKIKEINYFSGAHYCEPVGDIKWYDGNKIFLLHHKYISLDYVNEKHKIYNNRLSETNKQIGVGMEYLLSDIDRQKKMKELNDNKIDIVDLLSQPIEKEKPTICVSEIKSRLGNLLFEIACGTYYSEKTNKEFYGCIVNNDDLIYYNKLKPFIFKDYRILDNSRLLSKMNFTPLREKHAIEYAELKECDNNVVIFGYRQSPMYFTKDHALKLFRPSKQMIDFIKELYNDVDFTNTVSVHVRRGDYLLLKDLMYVLEMKYFNKAFSNFKKNQKYIIVSDDIEWCKQHFKGDNFIFADRQQSVYPYELIDLYIQTLCRDNIIDTSTFSWWGAYLNENENRKVYYHYPWIKNSKSRDIYPKKDNWKQVNL